MNLPPFLLDQWLAQKNHPNSAIEFDLGSSTGPSWTFRELLGLSDGNEYERLLDTKLFYTPAAGTAQLREAIARLEGADPQDVQVVTGSAEALTILFFITAERGTNVVLPSPGFPAYSPLAESFGHEIRKYQLRPEDSFRIDLDEIRALVDANTRLVLVNSPHNPTGAVLSEQEMETVHDFCAERGVQFVSDQVYHPIYHGAGKDSAASLPHATVLGDFSKALCLSGLRIGWIVDRDPRRRELYLNARNYFSICNTVLGEQLATLALENKDAIYSRAQKIAGSNLVLLEQFFQEHDDVFDWVRPEGGMTAFPWLTAGGDAREFCRRLANRGVLVAPGDCFGAPSHLRIGFAASGELFPAAMERFAALVREEVPV